LSLFGIVVYQLGERFILQGKVATLLRWGGLVSFSLLYWYAWKKLRQYVL